MIEIIETVAKMQPLAERLRCGDKRIALVPTMGYLHEGHCSLIRIAREKCDVAVTSIFVNPTQFVPGEDYEKYPRDFAADVRLAERAGCDIIFYPSVAEMYPHDYLTYVEVEEITRVLCGRSRPAHFRGVTTVVAKLFNIIKPHCAVFGQKDAQQAVVVRRMARDLNYDLEIIVAPIVREADGVAMSSRNAYLSPSERRDAVVLQRALVHAEEMIGGGERRIEHITGEMKRIINTAASSTIDYIEMVDCETLRRVSTIQGRVLIALAVKIGGTRLIDNTIVDAKK